MPWAARKSAGRISLPALRKRIDQVDRSLVRLLNQRALLARRVGALKRRRGLPVFDGKREQAVLRHVIRASRGSLPTTSLRAVFRAILRQSRELEKQSVVRSKRKATVT